MGNGHRKLTAREREERFLSGRIARAISEAKQTDAEGNEFVPAGNLVRFPVMVVVERERAYGDMNMRSRVERAAPLREYPFRPSHEPGPFPAGLTVVEIELIKAGPVALSYWFDVVIGDCDFSPQWGYTLLSGSESAAQKVLRQLPKGISMPLLSVKQLRPLVARAERDGANAYDDLAREGMNLIHHVAVTSFDRHAGNSLATPDEVRAGAHEHLCETIQAFCSPERPLHVTWGRVLFVSGQRDMDRAFHTYEPEREDVRAVRARIERHLSETTDPEKLHRLVCRDSTRRMLRKKYISISVAELEARVDEAEAKGELLDKISLAKIRRVMEAPSRSTISLEAPVSGADGTATIADAVAVAYDPDVTEYSLADAALVLCGDNELLADMMRPFFHCMGLASGSDDAARPRALPSAGPSGRFARKMFEPFLNPGEVWTKAEHRDRARQRAYDTFTIGGRLRPAEEIVAIWRDRYGDTGTEALAEALMEIAATA